MKKPETLPDSGRSGGLLKSSVPRVDHCPSTPDRQRWSADDGGVYCRLCWRDFSDPKPLKVGEARA